MRARVQGIHQRQVGSSQSRLQRTVAGKCKGEQVSGCACEAWRSDRSALRLQETKLINHKSLKLVQENEQHIREIEEILKKDRRYLVLDYMPDERTKLIVTYLEDLDKRGPPPPPTASEPTRRPTK